SLTDRNREKSSVILCGKKHSQLAKEVFSIVLSMTAFQLASSVIAFGSSVPRNSTKSPPARSHLLLAYWQQGIVSLICSMTVSLFFKRLSAGSSNSVCL